MNKTESFFSGFAVAIAGMKLANRKDNNSDKQPVSAEVILLRDKIIEKNAQLEELKLSNEKYREECSNLQSELLMLQNSFDELTKTFILPATTISNIALSEFASGIRSAKQLEKKIDAMTQEDRNTLSDHGSSGFASLDSDTQDLAMIQQTLGYLLSNWQDSSEKKQLNLQICANLLLKHWGNL